MRPIQIRECSVRVRDFIRNPPVIPANVSFRPIRVNATKFQLGQDAMAVGIPVEVKRKYTPFYVFMEYRKVAEDFFRRSRHFQNSGFARKSKLMWNRLKNNERDEYIEVANYLNYGLEQRRLELARGRVRDPVRDIPVPKKPCTLFNCYQKRMSQTIRRRNPGISPQELAKKIGEEWKRVNDDMFERCIRDARLDELFHDYLMDRYREEVARLTAY